MDYGLLFAWIAGVCMAIALMLGLPAYIVGTTKHVKEGGWRVIKRKKRLPLSGYVELDTDMVTNAACQALTKWKRLWSGTWPRFLYSHFKMAPEPTVQRTANNQFTISVSYHGTYKLRILGGQDQYPLVEVRRSDSRYKYVAAPILGIFIGGATNSIFTTAFSIVVLATIGLLGDPTGMGWYFANEVATLNRKDTHCKDAL